MVSTQRSKCGEVTGLQALDTGISGMAAGMQVQSLQVLPRDAGMVSRGEIITGMVSSFLSEKVVRKRDSIREAFISS
jgi:hypothetical protein